MILQTGEDVSKLEAKSTLLSDFSMDWVEKNFDKRARKIVKRYVKGVRTLGKDRIKDLVENGSDKLCLYVCNHQTILDYSIPMYAIIREGLPYARSVAGQNLNNWVIRNFMMDIGKWGVIWFDRSNNSVDHVKEYLRAVRQNYEEGLSLLGFPEAGRNRNIGGDTLEFKDEFFRAVLGVQREIDKPIYVVNMAIDYDRIPEAGYYELIDQGSKLNWLKKLRYFGWDAWASARWKYLDNEKTVARVNFGDPISIEELAGKGNRRVQAINAANNSRDIVVELLNEARSKRRHLAA